MSDTVRFAAVATVATATPERYAKQLATHLGRRCEVREESGGTRLLFGAGDCLLSSEPDALRMELTATDADELTRLEQVVGSHLERFGQRNELHVVWQPEPGGLLTSS